MNTTGAFRLPSGPIGDRLVSLNTKMMNPGFKFIGELLELERKGRGSNGPRYVRTAAGAKKYGKPIGSLITASDRKRVGRPPIIERSVVGRDWGWQQSQLLYIDQPKHSQYRPRKGSKTATNALEKLNPVQKRLGGALNWHSPPRRDGLSDVINLVQTSTGEWRAEIKDKSSSWFSTRQIIGSDPEVTFEAAAKLYMARRKRLSNKKSQSYDYEEQWSRNRSKRDYESSFDHFSGIRGYDWSGDDDPEVDWEDDESREEMQDREAADLGYEIKRGNITADGDRWDNDALENTNATMRMHEDRYPGMGRLFSSIALSTYSKGAVAWNLTHDHHAVNREGGATAIRQFTMMGMNPRYFSNTDWTINPITKEEITPYDRLVQMVENEKFEDEDVNFFSVSSEQLMNSKIGKKHNLNEQQAMTIRVMTHEIGHTVGFILQGRMARDGESMKHNLRPPGSALTDRKRSELLDLLHSYGVLHTDIREGNHDRDASQLLNTPGTRPGEGFDRHRDYIDREALSEHVSVYGSTNAAEMFAETWASYQLSDNPTEFVQELGALMEETLEEFLSEETGAREKWLATGAVGANI